jgi:hypothetical protein
MDASVWRRPLRTSPSAVAPAGPSYLARRPAAGSTAAVRPRRTRPADSRWRWAALASAAAAARRRVTGRASRTDAAASRPAAQPLWLMQRLPRPGYSRHRRARRPPHCAWPAAREAAVAARPGSELNRSKRGTHGAGQPQVKHGGAVRASHVQPQQFEHAISAAELIQPLQQAHGKGLRPFLRHHAGNAGQQACITPLHHQAEPRFASRSPAWSATASCDTTLGPLEMKVLADTLTWQWHDKPIRVHRPPVSPIFGLALCHYVKP